MVLINPTDKICAYIKLIYNQICLNFVNILSEGRMNKYIAVTETQFTSINWKLLMFTSNKSHNIEVEPTRSDVLEWQITLHT